VIIRIVNPIDAALRLALRIAHRRWNNRERIPDGVPGIRDIENPCKCYSPSERTPILGEDALGCQGDGHYLCRECRWLVEENG
jgi:hypothetical protein